MAALVVLATVILSLLAPTAKSADDVIGPQIIDGVTYYHVRHERNYNDAKTWCQNEYGAVLASPKSAEEIAQYLPNGIFYEAQDGEKDLRVGLGDQDVEGVYEFEDGTPFNNNFPFNTNLNDLESRDCAVVLWNDDIVQTEQCGHGSYFVCQGTTPPMCDTYNGWSSSGSLTHCYKLFPENVPWLKALQNCRQEGGILAEPRTQEELDYLIYLAGAHNGGNYVWTGAHDLRVEGRYEYFSDCSVFTADQEAFFWNTEPDNWTYEYYYGENCMAVDPRWVNPDDGGLRDQGCKYELSYVCQKYQ